MIEPKDSIKSIEAYDAPLFEEKYDLKVDANENVFGASDKVIDAIKNITKEKILKYPHYGNLTQKIAEYTGVEINQIKVTNGADEALFSLIQAYISDGDEMITVAPSFSMPILYAKIVGGNVIEIPYKNRWKFPTDEFLETINNHPKIKIIHLTSPNNPTGECIDVETAEKIINFAKDKLVIFDETYAGYGNVSMLSKVSKYDNLAVVKSFSKDFALAGLRIGYIVTHPERIRTLKTIIAPYSVNAIAAIAAEAALSDIEHLEKIKTEVKKSKNILSEGLRNLGFEVFPSEANFVFFDAGEKADYVYHTLLKNSIKIRKFSDEKMKGLIRITAPDCENAKKIINLLQPKRTLIFDMDGVLVDVSNSYRTTIKLTYEHFANKNLEYDEISKAKALGGLNNDWDLTEYLLKRDGFTPSKSEIIDVFEKIYFNEGKGLIAKEKFLLDTKFLQEISKQYNIAIFTGRPRNEALFTLNLNKITKFLYPIITMDDLPQDKQKPDITGIEIIKSKLLSKEIFYFGDTKDDMICGTNANVIPIGVLPPQDKSEEMKNHLSENGAKKVISTINAILTSIEREN